MTGSSGETTLAGSFGGEPDPRERPSAVGPGSVVGRLVVLHKLGSGGMGVVYAAYDPELDRKVALKLLLPGSGGETGRARLVREAQALARLSHPNVVGIHDVGTVGGQVWLAMEFVEGRTLGQWLRTPRGWREVLEVMRKAGEGLAAAHAAGLLHRDFKPDNVMVGDDGRVRVMDFGLARMEASAVSGGPTSAGRPTPDPQVEPPNGVTRVGAVVGTPGYMAPEQFGGDPVTAAADQFAFCITLWEALYGERPFGGSSSMEVAASVLEGKVRPPANPRAAPPWLRRACERGLLVDPTRRWPAMSALLDTLAKGRSRAAARKGVAALGVVALIGVGVEGHHRWDRAQRVASCEATGHEVDAAWNEEREHALRAALVATGVSYAPTTANKVTPWLDRRAEAWREARVEACLELDVRGQWDATTHERALWCLEERRMELESLVDELMQADADVVQRAVTAAAGLTSVTMCGDAKTLEIPIPPAADREPLRTVSRALVRAGSLQRAGRYAKGLEVAREALARAEALGWPPLIASARARVGSLEQRSGNFAAAEVELERAYFEAARGVAPSVSFDAALALVYVVGVSAARFDEGRRWARLADVALDEVPDGERLREAGLTLDLSNINQKSGDYEEAQRLSEEALAIWQEALGADHPTVAYALNNLASILSSRGERQAAKLLYGQALAIWEEALGPEHPDVAMTLNNLAALHETLGDYDVARRHYERALAILEPALGPEHPNVAYSLNNLGIVYKETGEYEEAKRVLDRAVAIRERALGPKHPSLGISLYNLANVYAATGDHAEAKRLLERSIAIWEEALGPNHPHLAAGLIRLAAVHHESGDPEQAKRLYERALAIDEARDPESPELAEPLLGLAKVALAQQRASDALALAERAVSLQEKGGVAGAPLAKARFALARALWAAPAEAGGDRTRAVALAEQSRELAEAAAWLATHAPQ